MLYGMDDYDEYGLIKKPKLNIKKVILFIIILLLCVIIVFVSFKISYNIMSNNSESLGLNKKVENNETNFNVIKEKNTNKIKKGNNKNLAYEGEHVKIPNHDIEKIKTKFVPVFNENGPKLIKDIYFSEEKQVYLTFDDGPSKDITPRILDILKENDVVATFFVLGARVELYPETLKREFEEGHYIANHGYSHKYSQIYENKDTVFQEFIDCENSIKKALNNEDYNSYLFRFPGGSTGGRYEKIKAQARSLFTSYGIAFTNWNCLTGDAEGSTTKEECLTKMINTKGDSNSIILLMHDANDKEQTVESLPEVIKYFKDEGYTFKNFYDIFK